MILSDAQLGFFWREWPKACRAMNWTREAGLSAKEIDAKRKDFLQRCGFDSLTKVDRTEGFTRVKNELLLLQRPDLKAARETIDPSLNEARILRHGILTDLIPCLELYIPDVRAYLGEVLFHQGQEMRDLKLMQLTAPQLRRLRFTISARLNEKRKASGDTIHDMRTKAGVKCQCAKCSRPVSSTKYLAPVSGPAELVADPF